MQTHHAPPATTGGRRGLLACATIAAVAALTVLPALPAAAHDELISATPAAGATLTTAPSTVVLTFSAALLELGGGKNGVQVVDAAGRHFETACATVSGDRMTSPVRLGAAGTYSVGWRGISSDGHAVADTYTFDYRPAAGTAAAAGSATGPSCGGGATAAQEPAASAAPSATTAVLVGAIGAAVLLAVVVTVLVLVLRLRRADDEEAGR